MLPVCMLCILFFYMLFFCMLLFCMLLFCMLLFCILCILFLCMLFFKYLINASLTVPCLFLLEHRHQDLHQGLIAQVHGPVQRCVFFVRQV